MSSSSLLLKKNFPLISLVLVIIVAFSAPFSLASPTTTTTTTELPAINSTDVAAITTTTESFYDFLVRVAFSNTPSSARATTEAVTPPSNSLSFGILSPSGRIARSNLTIPEWVRTQRKPDVEALAISLSLMPEIRSELNSSVSRYSSLGWWDVYELELDNTAPWDLLMGFLREYPQICDAFTNTSHYAKLPACLNRLYLEPRKKLIEDRTPWMCRTSPFASACTAQKALLGTGLNDAVVEMWQRRMRAFSLYQREVAPVQASRLVATEEASCYWYVFCLKVNAADDAGLRKCLDNVVKFGGLIH